MTLEALGDRIKRYEQRETDRTPLEGAPIVVRVDGRGFSRFTAGMAKPFDVGMAELMAETATYLLAKTHAVVAYTQSDEISLILEAPGGDPSRSQDIFFGGRFQKLTSIIGGLATACFIRGALQRFPQACAQELPVFDARVFSVPNRDEAINALIWREFDATKNAISMAASAHYPHRELQGKSGAQRQEMLFQKGINFNDYPTRFKRGVFFQRRSVEQSLTPEELERIPVRQRPEGPVRRHAIVALDLPPLTQIANRREVIFEQADPVSFAPAVVAAPSRGPRRRP